MTAQAAQLHASITELARLGDAARAVNEREAADDLGETFDQFCARQDAEEAARNEASEIQRDRDADVRAYRENLGNA